MISLSHRFEKNFLASAGATHHRPSACCKGSIYHPAEAGRMRMQRPPKESQVCGRWFSLGAPGRKLHDAHYPVSGQRMGSRRQGKSLAAIVSIAEMTVCGGVIDRINSCTNKY